MGGLFGGGGSTIATSEPRIGALRIQTSSYGLAIPLVYGRQRISGNLIWYGDFTPIAHTTSRRTGGKAGVTQVNTTYTYQTGLMIGLCEGAIVGIGAVRKGQSKYISLNDAGGMSAFLGALGQAVWGNLTTNHPPEAIGYSELAYVAHAAYDMGGNAQLENHSFEIIGPLQLSNYNGTYDCNPADVILDFLTHPTHGAGFPLNKLGDMTDFWDYCLAAWMVISPAFIEQKPAQEYLLSIVEAVNCEFVFSEGLLKIIPRADSPVHGFFNLVYTPNISPQYDLTDDDFLDADRPVVCRRSATADAFNAVQIEFTDRNNDYNVGIALAQDQANIEAYGLRQEDVQKMNFICNSVVAQKVAQARLQRILYIRNEYDFTLGWSYARLEPMDIVTITDAYLGLDRYPVRIFSTEENEQGDIAVTAREFPIGVADPAIYSNQQAGGFSAGWNALPGNINAPLLFEPPLGLTGGNQQLWMLASGGADWGGCGVWMSLDNATYERIGDIFGAARYGILNQTLAAPAADPDVLNTLAVDLNTDGQILASNQASVDALASLCYCGGELLAYRDATLLSVRRYGLSYLRRGLYGTLAGNHPIGAQFARLDQAVFRHVFNANLLGKVVYFKFTSFNAFGKEEQSLASVTAYNRTLTGGGLTGPANLSLQSPFVGLSFKTQWAAVIGASSYGLEIWNGGILRRTSSTTSTTFTYTLADALLDGGPWRDFTIKVRSVSGVVLSAWSQLNVSNPTPAVPANIIIGTVTATSIALSWNAIADADMQDYQVWISTTAGFTPGAATLASTSTAISATLSGLTTATTYYIRIAARDQWGAATLNYSAELTQVTL